eukprot:2652720-Alexandrium_andersonii.AAC.2
MSGVATTTAVHRRNMPARPRFALAPCSSASAPRVPTNENQTLQAVAAAVSYTHLRAHETSAHL